jgi:AcrR family transcriptional regulator
VGGHGRARIARVGRGLRSGARPRSRKAAPSVALLPRVEQAGERRRQLLQIASELVERGGVDACTLSEVTARAGCARTLVYRYFASREELLIGVIHDYFERLDERLSDSEQRSAVAEVVAESRRGAPVAAHGLVALFWDVQVAAGLGGAILRTSPFLSAEMQSLVEASRERFERRYTEPLRAAGLSEHEARVALDSMITSFVSLSLRARAGEITRAKAIDIHSRATVGLLRGLLGT